MCTCGNQHQCASALALTARAARGLARTSATTRNKVVFVGAGSFGSAMALVAASPARRLDQDLGAARRRRRRDRHVQRRNGRYLPEDADPFPSNVEATTDLRGAVAKQDCRGAGRARRVPRDDALGN